MSKAYVFLSATPVDYTLASNKREVWMPKGDLSYFDKSARRRFESRREKRDWLTQHGMREAGELINPNKAPDGGALRPALTRRRSHDV